MAVVAERAGNKDQALVYFRAAIEGYREDLAEHPDSARIAGRLGNALAATGNFGEAAMYFQQAVTLNPYDIKNHSMLAQALAAQGHYDDAITGLTRAIVFMRQTGDQAAAAELQKYLESLESIKPKQQQ
jgi:tetratricopeptide (TPR) repeat protein